MITIADLVEALSSFPSDLPVVMSKDAEGNGFSPFADLGQSRYAADSTWSGELYNEDEIDEYSPDTLQVVCLWPVN